MACSGETVGVAAKTVADCREALAAMAGYDEKDGTSLPASMYQEIGAVKKGVAKG